MVAAFHPKNMSQGDENSTWKYVDANEKQIHRIDQTSWIWVNHMVNLWNHQAPSERSIWTLQFAVWTKLLEFSKYLRLYNPCDTSKEIDWIRNILLRPWKKPSG